MHTRYGILHAADLASCARLYKPATAPEASADPPEVPGLYTPDPTTWR
jgi:hypothetical protein